MLVAAAGLSPEEQFQRLWVARLLEILVRVHAHNVHLH
jgi:hypothetical protein